MSTRNTTTTNTTTTPLAVGIDRISFATPHYYLNLTDLANARGIDPNKFTIGIGQSEQSVPPNHQDIVTLAAQAALPLLPHIDSNRLKMLIVGTESGVDASKSSALYVQNLLKLTPWVRVVEVKEACYGGTAALMMACDYVRAHAEKDPQVLVIASDIARYGLATPGEVTQGAGAVAMLVSANPHVLKINDDSVVKSADIQDFWRPVYQDTALARGKFSTEQYIEFFCDVWQKYCAQNDCNFNDFAGLCFHLPYTKMGLKALKAAMDTCDNTCDNSNLSESSRNRLLSRYETSTKYSRRVGNIYTGSLYLGLLSLLELDGLELDEFTCENSELPPLKSGDKIGLFSYGSGAVGEFFSATLVPGFKDALFAREHADMLDSRVRLSVADYEAMFSSVAPYAPEDFVSDTSHRECANFFLDGISSQERHYRSN
ncbi:hydroxymethylglutaryl-CoA synthase [Bifidobacteriaceae bacterium NR044]|nr:hydroxymethylglutaryl-CoA synthase [Bifidobacteriaceae bacterium NR043]MBF9353651.1 hydroxymethylglutaryl-CoA synthase [Bifidobacteriaceae bacterium NR044]RFT39637.1 hydroxymethylglutaryl-CoA synthase [Bifidobacteriaceae bacterium NR003]